MLGTDFGNRCKIGRANAEAPVQAATPADMPAIVKRRSVTIKGIFLRRQQQAEIVLIAHRAPVLRRDDLAAILMDQPRIVTGEEIRRPHQAVVDDPASRLALFGDLEVRIPVVDRIGSNGERAISIDSRAGVVDLARASGRAMVAADGAANRHVAG